MRNLIKPLHLLNLKNTTFAVRPLLGFKAELEELYRKLKNELKDSQKYFERFKKGGEPEDRKRFLQFLGFLAATLAMYQLKKSRGTESSAIQLFESIKTSETDTIEIIKYIDKMNDDAPTAKPEPLQYEVRYKVNGLIYYVAIDDPEQLIERIKAEEEFKTYKTKIIEREVIAVDVFLKRHFSLFVKVIIPLMLPFLLFNSSMGKVFQNKFFGQLDGLRPNIFFSDVAGLGNAKIEVSQLVDFLKNPRKYKAIGARVPKGALLAGPPGTGKTMLAKACAGEAEVPFFSVSGSQFVELYAGMGANRVRELFKNAKKQTPAIIFIDQIDAIGRKREDKFGGANDERANTLNQLLVEMDGFGTSDDIIVLAATNRKQMLDSALTRPGRFDRIVEIDLPDIQGRKEILKIYLDKIKISPDQTLDEYAKRISTLTFGFSGADLANLCNEAAILAVRKEKAYVEPSDFESASDRVLAGLEQNFNLDQKEKRKVAYHECGHAVASWFLEGASPLLKITIVPRSKGSLGFAQYLPNESSLMTKQMLEDQICVALGGRIAEQFFFKEVSNGAADDLNKVRQMARAMVVTYGMNATNPNYAPVSTDGHNVYSEKTASEIDEDVKKLIDDCTKRTRELMKIHQEKIRNLAEAVLKKESLNHKEITEILGERPFEVKQNYREFLETTLAESKFDQVK